MDWVIVAVLVCSTLLAAAEGFFYEIFTLSGAVVGIIAATWEYPRLAVWLLPYVKSEAVANGCSFVAIFFASCLLAGAIGRLARWATHKVGLSWADRMLGAAFGLVRGIVMITATVTALAAFVPESKLVARSELSRYFFLSARTVTVVGPAELRDRVKRGVIALEKPERKESSR